MPSKQSSESVEYPPTPAHPMRALTTRVIGYKCKTCGFTRGPSRGHKECPLARFCPNCLHEALVNSEIPRLEVVEEVIPVSEVPLIKTKRHNTDDVETVIMPRTSARMKRKKKR